jgi:acetyl-CoA carboxylase carboxyltransferase component
MAGMSEPDASWEPEVAELRARLAHAEAMGGEAGVQRQHDRGRLTVRERIAAILDPSSFREIGALAVEKDENGPTPVNVVFGRGDIGGRPVIVVGDDFTIRGGSMNDRTLQKLVYPERLAGELRLPLIKLIESGGGSIKTTDGLGHTYVSENAGWGDVVRNLGIVPVVGLALGPAAGLAGARVVASHYSVMVAGHGVVFAGGPPLVAQVGEVIDKEALGGSKVHGANGVVTDVVKDEPAAFERAQRFLSYLPPSVYELPPRGPQTDDPQRRDEWLISAIPKDRRKTYKIRPVVETLVDEGSFFEMGRRWAPSIVCGFARLDGWPVAVLTEDGNYGGVLTAEGARKTEWFVDLAETFHLPMVRLVDQPGIAIGSQAERDGTMRASIKAFSAIGQATIPWCSVLIRKVFGVGGAGHSNPGRVQYRFAWPSGHWGSLPTTGGLEAAYKSELDGHEDREGRLAELEARIRDIESPFRTAEAFGVEDIIDPRDTRARLCEFANLAAPLRSTERHPWGFRG